MSVSNTPAIVVMPELYRCVVLDASRIQRCSHLIDGRPLPGEIHLGGIAILHDSSNAQQFSTGDGHAKILRGLSVPRHKVAEGVHPKRSKCNVPTGWGPTDPSTRCRCTRYIHASNPSMVLQDQIFRGGVVFCGHDSGAQPELLRRLEGVGPGD